MRRLTERTEIAKAINFNEYPVVKIDLADVDDYGVKGTKVRIDIGKAYHLNAVIRAYSDEKVLTTQQYGTMLTKDVSYNDYMEMVEYATAPIIKPDQEIVIFLFNSKKREVYEPAIIKTGARVDRFCQTPLSLEKFEIL